MLSFQKGGEAPPVLEGEKNQPGNQEKERWKLIGSTNLKKNAG